MSAEATAWAKAQLARRDLIPSVERTLLALAKAQPKSGAAVKMTYAQISAQTRDTRRTVMRCVKILVSEGLVIKDTGLKNQRQHANTYTLRGVTPSHPKKRVEGCQDGNSSDGDAMSPLNMPRGDTKPPPNARTRAGLGATEESIPLEEMELAVWAGLRVVGGRDV